jgi:hypothetical protein
MIVSIWAKLRVLQVPRGCTFHMNNDRDLLPLLHDEPVKNVSFLSLDI